MHRSTRAHLATEEMWEENFLGGNATEAKGLSVPSASYVHVSPTEGGIEKTFWEKAKCVEGGQGKTPKRRRAEKWHFLFAATLPFCRNAAARGRYLCASMGLVIKGEKKFSTEAQTSTSPSPTFSRSLGSQLQSGQKAEGSPSLTTLPIVLTKTVAWTYSSDVSHLLRHLRQRP